MGFFNKKNQNDRKIYSMGEAIIKLKKPEYQGYTTIPVGFNGYMLVPEESLKTVSSFEEKRKGFLSQMVVDTKTQRNSGIPNYNNYQSAKNYQKSEYYKS